MRRIYTFFGMVVAVLLFIKTAPDCFAYRGDLNSEEIIYIQKEIKGDYTYVTVLSTTSQENSQSATRQIISGSKTKYAMDSSGKSIWSITVNATFSYNGSVATCVGAYHTTGVYMGGWSVTSSSTSVGIDSATASGTAERRVMGVVTESDFESVSIHCDPNGNIS